MQTTNTIGIIAYTYDADYHCILCTAKNFGLGFTFSPIDGIYFSDNKINSVKDDDGNEIHPVFQWQEWQDLDESYLVENPTPYLACGDCHKIIEIYKHQGEK